jgi:hypothetical protein
MDKETLLKLKKNPHYKMSREQKISLSNLTRRPMIEFGSLPKHDNTLNIHSGLKKKNRRKK